MKKNSFLIFTTIISFSNISNTQATDWNNFINRFDTNNCNNNYSTGQYNVKQSDLDEVDKFIINDYMINNPPEIKVQYNPSNNFINNIISKNNADRKFSYDVSNNRYNTLQNYQMNARNVKSRNRPSTAEHYYDANTTYQVLPNIYLPPENITNNRPLSRNKNRNEVNDIFNKTNPKIAIKKENQPINLKCIPFSKVTPLQQDNKIINVNYNVINENPYVVNPVPQVNNNNQNKESEKKLTNEQLVQLLSNGSPNLNDIPTVKDTIYLNKNLQSNNNNLNNLENIKVKKVIKVPNNTRSRNRVHSDVSQYLTEVNNKQKNVIPNVQPVIKQNISPGAKKHKRLTTMDMPRIPIDTDYKTIDANRGITERHIVKPIIQKIKRINTERSKSPITVRIPTKEIIQNNIITHWENGINQDEINSFLNNIKDLNAFTNTKMQIYSLLGEIAPSLGDPDKIRLLFDVLKYNSSNKDEKHIYNYEKPLALNGIFIEYYLHNVDLYNSNLEKFNLNIIETAKYNLKYDEQDYLEATQILNKNQYYTIVNKIVKGVNLIEAFKKDNNENKKALKQLHLSNGIDWFISTFQLFDYALQCSSNSNDKINKTTFAEFDKYLQNNSQHLDINERIQFIPTLKDFVNQNEKKFSNNKVNSALEVLYKEEDSNISCPGVMGSIIMFRIFPELKTIFSSNQFGKHDSIIDLANKFSFSNNQPLAQQFNEQAQDVLKIASHDNGRRLFNNTDYLIMVTTGLTRDQVINDRKYISGYHEKTNNNQIEKLELYKLVGVQLCNKKDNDYVTISGEKLKEAVSTKDFGKICITKNLQPMQALYKLVSQDDYNKHIVK